MRLLAVWTETIDSDCVRCSGTTHGLIACFVHDVREWGWGTAFYNVWFLLSGQG